MTPSPFEHLQALQDRFDGADAKELIAWAIERYGDQFVVASSFGVEDLVLIDLALELNPNVRIATLDTGRLHQETYDVMAKVRQRYDINLEILVPEQTQLQALLSKDGPNGFYESVDQRRACCKVRKLNPLGGMLSGAAAWATGLRQAQSAEREKTKEVELDFLNGPKLLKLNPLVRWSHAEIWQHIRDHDLPYNPLHDQGFPSIGCAPCTRAIKPGEHPRAGRWWWESKAGGECGLHAS